LDRIISNPLESVGPITPMDPSPTPNDTLMNKPLETIEEVVKDSVPIVNDNKDLLNRPVDPINKDKLISEISVPTPDQDPFSILDNDTEI